MKEWNERQHYNQDGSLKKKDKRKMFNVLEELPEYEYWIVNEENKSIVKFNINNIKN